MPGKEAHLEPVLFELAVHAFASIPTTNEDHTVAAVVRSRCGKTFVALNVYHFTGGPCAELAALGTAAAGGVVADQIETILAVVRRTLGPGDASTFTVVNPCGRCRQVLLDYNPSIQVIILNSEGKESRVAAKDLLPFAYVWEDGNAGRKEEHEVLEG